MNEIAMVFGRGQAQCPLRDGCVLLRSRSQLECQLASTKYLFILEFLECLSHQSPSKRSPHGCFNRKANRRCVLKTLKPAQKSRSPLRVLGKVTTRRKLLPNALKLSCEAKGTTTFSLVEKWKYRLLKKY